MKARRKRYYPRLLYTDRSYFYKIQIKILGIFWVTIKKYEFCDLRGPYITLNKGVITHHPTPNFTI